MRNDNPRETGILDTGHYVGLKFQQGWWFFQVHETEFIELKPWILLNENGNRAEIAPRTAGSEDDEIEDTLDRKFLTPQNSEKSMVFQIRFGIQPSRMQVFPIFGRNRSPNLRGSAEPGEPQVAVTGYDSPYNDPSDQAELFSVNSQEPLSLQAYNPTDEPLEARLSFHVNKIKYATVTDTDLMKAMLEGNQPFRGHEMGLGASSDDQMKAPQWVMDHFGDHIMKTSEILTSGQSSSNIPNPSGGTTGGDVV